MITGWIQKNAMIGVMLIMASAGLNFLLIPGLIIGFIIQLQLPGLFELFMLLFAVLNNIIAALLICKIWSWPEQRVVWGFRRQLWKIFLATSYGLGLTGLVSLMILHHFNLG